MGVVEQKRSKIMKKKRKTDIRTEIVLKTLYKGLEDSLRTKSISNIFICEICDAVEVHRTTFYKHFKDKYDLLNNYIKYSLKPIREIEYDIDVYSTPKDFYNTLVEKFFAYISEYKELIKEILIADEEHGDFVNASKEVLKELISEKLVEVETAGYTLSSSNGVLSAIYSGAIVSLIQYWVTNKNISKDLLIKAVSSLIS